MLFVIEENSPLETSGITVFENIGTSSAIPRKKYLGAEEKRGTFPCTDYAVSTNLKGYHENASSPFSFVFHSPANG